MATFDPEALRKAIEAFVPLRTAKFQNLNVAKDMIAELRRKNASYAVIADLLNQHGLETSRSALAAFCHDALGEQLRGRRRRSGKRSADSKPLTTTAPAAEPTAAPVTPPLGTMSTTTPAPEKRGPRVARLQFSKPTPP